MSKRAPVKKPIKKPAKKAAKRPNPGKARAKKSIAKKPPVQRKAKPVSPRLKKRLEPPVPVSVTMTAEITTELHGQRLDKALTMLLVDQMPGLSRVRLQGLMADGHITLIMAEGEKIEHDASRKAKLGDIYQVILPPPEAATPEAQNIELDIIFEDKDLLVINKPAGMVVHPAPGNRDKTLVNALLGYCGASLSGIGGVARPGIVHRLDKDTSGLMVVAKNDLAHQGLTAQFADRSLSRTYQAVVWGEPVPLAGTIDAPIGRHSRDRIRMTVTQRGKHAVTHYHVIDVLAQGVASFIECRLETGRTHQIRVHMAHIKNPVAGDPAYGPRRPKTVKPAAELLRQFPRQALHAMELKFEHPRSHKPMQFQVEMPKDMATLVRKLQKM